MHKILRFILKFLKWAMVIFLIPVMLVYYYLIYAAVASIIPEKSTQPVCSTVIKTFVHTNGFHTDIIIPANDTLTGIKWMPRFNKEGLDTLFHDCRYISFSWGDRDFYMESFGGVFPSISTTLKAIFLPTPALMHIEFYSTSPVADKETACLLVPAVQYRELCGYISSSFTCAEGSQQWKYYHSGYGPDDYFYMANGSYHLFHTCNDWTNDALKHAGAPHAWKAPFAEIVMCHVTCSPGYK